MVLFLDARLRESKLFAIGSAVSNTIEVQDPDKTGFETAQAGGQAAVAACAGSTTYDR